MTQIDRRPPAGHPSDEVTRDGYQLVKRTLDIVIAGPLLILLLPLLLVVAGVVRATSTGPALFRQPRVGRGGRTFTMLKFRTMRDGCSDELHRDFVRRLLTGEQHDSAGRMYKLDRDPRVTALGRVLRRTSVDELPQLFNVLRGEMSLVGPRPVLPWEAALLQDGYAERFAVPPGVTGLWQISGRSTLSMRQALDLDLEYVRRRGLAIDLRILAKTTIVVLRLGDAR